MKMISILGAIALLCAHAADAANLSPGQWPAADRSMVEQQESQGFSPSQTQLIESDKGLVSADRLSDRRLCRRRSTSSR